jgi:hypothetical protein
VQWRTLARPRTPSGTVRRRRNRVSAGGARQSSWAGSPVARARPIVGAASGVLRQTQAGTDIRHDPPSWFAERANRPAMSSSSSIEARTQFQGRERLVSWSSLGVHIANGSRISPAKLSLDEPPGIHRHRDAANDRRLAEHTPRVGVDRDPRRRVGAWHGATVPRVAPRCNCVGTYCACGVACCGRSA